MKEKYSTIFLIKTYYKRFHTEKECAVMMAKLHNKNYNVNIHCLNQEFALTKKKLTSFTLIKYNEAWLPLFPKIRYNCQKLCSLILFVLQYNFSQEMKYIFQRQI